MEKTIEIFNMENYQWMEIEVNVAFTAIVKTFGSNVGMEVVAEMEDNNTVIETIAGYFRIR